MNDRFKFRLWDKSISEMSYDVCVGFIKDGGRRDWVCADICDGQINYCGDKLKDIVLMQCTGLKDKNGKLIYEGDIVIEQDFDIKPQKKIVAWIKDVMQGFNINLEYEYEVIGNIYENPELLERVNDD